MAVGGGEHWKRFMIFWDDLNKKNHSVSKFKLKNHCGDYNFYWGNCCLRDNHTFISLEKNWLSP